MIRTRAMGSLALGFFIGALGVLFSHLPGTVHWEEEFGLGLLFNLRGQRPPPQEVMILSINGQTGEQLALAEELLEWPRSLHAELIERLTQAGAALIVFDIFFKKPRDPAGTEQMAKAMRHAGNVLLVGYLEQRQMINGQQTMQLERLVSPTEPLTEAALGIAPFMLPKVPVKVSRFWTFNGENELMTLPAIALQWLADPDRESLNRLLSAAGQDPRSSGISDVFERQRLLRGDGQLRRRMIEELHRGLSEVFTPLQRQRLTALLKVYDSDPYPWLNFYGPPGSIERLPVEAFLRGEVPVIGYKDKVVFIGHAGDYQPKQKDGFYTVFTQSDGLDLSGVEIAATAFANLLRMETLSPLPPVILVTLLLTYGLVITLLFRYLPGLPGVLAGLLLAGAYLALVYLLFAEYNLWLPWFVPLVLQTPLALIISLSWHYHQQRLSRTQLRELFGFYLPGDVIDRLVENQQAVNPRIDSAYGVCLASDAQNYTRMAETMEPQALQAYLNRYYEILFAPVRARAGVVSDVVGDSMLAIWPATRPEPSLRQKACEAALEISQAVEMSDLEPRLFTRIGLHAGELVMSHVGALDHFEYRAVGDMVNTASRIENFNKRLGTSILASREFVEGLRDIVIRELGEFSLAGKRQRISLFEIVAKGDSLTPSLSSLHSSFAAALADWKDGDREAAYEKFRAIQREYPQDGPTGYYLQQHLQSDTGQDRPME